MMHSWTNIRIAILGTTVGVVAVLTGWRKASFDPSHFYPVDLPLPDEPAWQYIGGSPLTPHEDWTGYRYLYRMTSQEKSILDPLDSSTPLTLRAEVFLPAGESPAPIQDSRIFSALVFQSDRDLSIPSSRIQQDLNTGYFGEFVDQNRAYLSTCILPEGGSVFNRSQHQQSRNILMGDPQHILKWIIGMRDLRDWKCLWTNLSLPIQGVDIPLPVQPDQVTPDELAELTEKTEKSFVLLRSFWPSWYDYWGRTFAAHR